MFQKWIKNDIFGHVVTRSSTNTQARRSQLVGKGTINHPQRQIIWEISHQMIIGRKWNKSLCKREQTRATIN